MIWTVSGAGRQVGKTTVAMSIADVLDSSIYCKCGHNAPKPEKPGNFFLGIEELGDFVDKAAGKFDHIVVESNTFVYSDRPDITIYIDGVDGVTDFRDDAFRLKAAADIIIAADSLTDQWEKFLSNKITDTKTVKAVCRLLSLQMQWLFRGDNECIKTAV